MDKRDIELAHFRLSSLGIFYPLSISFDFLLLEKQIRPYRKDWIPYNKSKPGYKRYGLSLFSLDGGVSGEIDLNSIKEYNEKNQTDYNELSFRKPTHYWHEFSSLSEPLKEIENNLGRSHLIKFDKGGFFPPHRDTGNTFRLISFFFCTHHHLKFLVDDKKFFFTNNRLYFLDTRKPHSVFSFQNNAVILVLNVEYSENSMDFVFKNIVER